MPEILKQGRKVDSWKTKAPHNLIFSCRVCGCEWRLKKGETASHVNDDEGHPCSYWYWTMDCPGCGQEAGRQVTTKVDRGMI